MPKCPLLLARATQSDKQNPTARVTNGADVGAVFIWSQSAEWWRAEPGDAQARYQQRQTLDKALQHIRAAAIQIDRQLLTRGGFAHVQHQRRAVDALSQPEIVQQVQPPAERLPVGGEYVKRVELATERLVDSRHRQAVNRRGGDQRRALGQCRLEDAGRGARVRCTTDQDSRDRVTWRKADFAKRAHVSRPRTLRRVSRRSNCRKQGTPSLCGGFDSAPRPVPLHRI